MAFWIGWFTTLTVLRCVVTPCVRIGPSPTHRRKLSLRNPRPEGVHNGCCKRWRNQLEAFRVVLFGAAALLLSVNLDGQSTTSTWIAGVLPPEAKVIETADLKIGRRA